MGIVVLAWVVPAAICHETRPANALQVPQCTATFKLTEERGEGRKAEREGARAQRTPLPLVVRTIEDDTWPVRTNTRT